MFPDLGSHFSDALSQQGVVLNLCPLRSPGSLASADLPVDTGNDNMMTSRTGFGSAATSGPAAHRSALLAVLLGNGERPSPSHVRLWLQSTALERGSIPIRILTWVPVDSEGRAVAEIHAQDDDDSSAGSVRADDYAAVRTTVPSDDHRLLHVHTAISVDGARAGGGEMSPGESYGLVDEISEERVVTAQGSADEPPHAAHTPPASSRRVSMSSNRRGIVAGLAQRPSEFGEQRPLASSLSHLVMSARAIADNEQPQSLSGGVVLHPHAPEPLETTRRVVEEPAHLPMIAPPFEVVAVPSPRVLASADADGPADPAAKQPRDVQFRKNPPQPARRNADQGILHEQSPAIDDADRGSVSTVGLPGRKILERLRLALTEGKNVKHRLPWALRLLWWSVIALTVVNVALATVQVCLAPSWVAHQLLSSPRSVRTGCRVSRGL